VNASPELYVPADQLGHGFMQYYGQDTLGASASSPYDFSVDPDAGDTSDPSRGAESIPVANNFFFFNQVLFRANRDLHIFYFC
jgi:hypothetical protein